VKNKELLQLPFSDFHTIPVGQIFRFWVSESICQKISDKEYLVLQNKNGQVGKVFTITFSLNVKVILCGELPK